MRSLLLLLALFTIQMHGSQEVELDQQTVYALPCFYGAPITKDIFIKAIALTASKNLSQAKPLLSWLSSNQSWQKFDTIVSPQDSPATALEKLCKRDPQTGTVLTPLFALLQNTLNELLLEQSKESFDQTKMLKWIEFTKTSGAHSCLYLTPEMADRSLGLPLDSIAQADAFFIPSKKSFCDFCSEIAEFIRKEFPLHKKIVLYVSEREKIAAFLKKNELKKRSEVCKALGIELKYIPKSEYFPIIQPN